MNILTFILQANAGAQPQGGSMSFILMMVLIFAVMWLFMIRPQRKQQKAIEQFRNELKKGSKVMTGGGILGEVVEVTDQTVLIKVDGEVKLRLDKNYITAAPGAPAPDKKQ